MPVTKTKQTLGEALGYPIFTFAAVGNPNRRRLVFNQRRMLQLHLTGTGSPKPTIQLHSFTTH